MFKLAKKLGGRREVIETPAVELFKYMEMEIEKDNARHRERQAEMYLNYLSRIFSQELQHKPTPEYLRAKSEFEKLINPMSDDKKKDNKLPKKLEWDFDVDEYIKQIEG